MLFKKFTVPIVILVVGLFLIAGAHACYNIVREPAVTNAEFPFSVTYELNGKTKTLKGTYTCSYIGHGATVDPTARFYTGTYDIGNAEDGNYHVIAEKDGEQLLICTPFLAGYLMGDELYLTPSQQPFLAVRNEHSTAHTDKEWLDRFGATILEWEFPNPIENTFAFSRIGRIADNSIYPMTVAAYLTLLVCVFFVIIDPAFCNTDTDRLSTAFNYFISIVFVPLIAVLANLIERNATGEALIHQIQFCIPAFSLLCVAASVCLRRKGLSVSSLVVQFFGPAAYVASLIVEVKM